MSDGLIPPLNAPDGGSDSLGVQPGVSSGVVIAQLVLVVGQNGAVLIYSPAPGAGNLVGSWAAAPGVDMYGNAYGEDITIGPSSGPQASLTRTGAGGQGAALEFFMNTADVTVLPLLIAQVVNASAVNQFLQMLIQGPAGTGNNNNQFNIVFNSDSDDGTIPAELIIYDQALNPFLAMQTTAANGPQMFIGLSPGGNSAFIPVQLNGALLCYGATGQKTSIMKTSGSGTIPIPAGVATVLAECGGGGGGGGGGSAPGTTGDGGAAGGGGEYAAEPALAAGATVAYSVGGGGVTGAAGAPNGSPGSNGGAGGNSTLTGSAVTVTGHGGGGGTGGHNGHTGGAGGSGYAGTTSHPGGTGGAASTDGTTTGGAGGGGSGGPGGSGGGGGGVGGRTPGNGGPGGGAPGGGGGGGGWGSTANNGTGGGSGGLSGGGGGGGGGIDAHTYGGGNGGGGWVRVTYTRDRFRRPGVPGRVRRYQHPHRHPDQRHSAIHAGIRGTDHRFVHSIGAGHLCGRNRCGMGTIRGGRLRPSALCCFQRHRKLVSMEYTYLADRGCQCRQSDPQFPDWHGIPDRKPGVPHPCGGKRVDHG